VASNCTLATGVGGCINVPIATAGAGCSVRAVDRLDYFAALVADDPTVARARFGYANELLRAGRDEDAVSELRAYLELAEDEGNAWGRLAEALARLGRPDEAADAYLTGIDQSLKHGHTGMAGEFQAALEAL
jgi:predicted Zn-dependent protease